MKQKLSIKQTYHDVLFMASSHQNKGEKFHINPTQFKIILKLIQYEKTDKNITFQNKDIAKHIYQAESTVKDAIEEIRNKGYITSVLNHYNNRLKFATKRTINLNWDFIQKLFDEYILPNSAIDTSLSTPKEIIIDTPILTIDEINPIIIIDQPTEPVLVPQTPSTTIVIPSLALEEVTTNTVVTPVADDKIVTEETPLKTEIKSDKIIRQVLNERLDIVLEETKNHGIVLEEKVNYEEITDKEIRHYLDNQLNDLKVKARKADDMENYNKLDVLEKNFNETPTEIIIEFFDDINDLISAKQ